MTICNNCKQYLPDIGGGHTCPNQPNYYTIPPVFYPPVYPVTIIEKKGQKCDVCGSTAIDHTEQQCQLNRTFKSVKIPAEKGQS